MISRRTFEDISNYRRSVTLREHHPLHCWNRLLLSLSMSLTVSFSKARIYAQVIRPVSRSVGRSVKSVASVPSNSSLILSVSPSLDLLTCDAIMCGGLIVGRPLISVPSMLRIHTLCGHYRPNVYATNHACHTHIHSFIHLYRWLASVRLVEIR
ncbi:hypothetical protein BDN70DRAFT_605449 [Pholiota conissans]|uniref:Uncharacterized protein n=1 Tax=Pholiota conissans TaxID=109636 RepID=A0A9P5YJP6_9AGAR|nr:hypothetical protein BDN70DRAFT_605449 [Pholiota conissans]